ncbi:Inner membrane transport permease YhhJ [Ensifer psoraleae]|uniref:ABC transporter permease n=1 Tax=Sinorhizobium psoraleae TaxID=520838 RepID=UPI00156948F6|nr:ABC transporter permease [Sinorhizobium psoraleae]NRP74762.1 Inner membrane transport permease YhhJ [Sinorhizobium psoraleae]
MRKRLINILALGVKELYSIRADPVMLVLILYTFTYAVYAVATGAKLEVYNASVAIVDEDRSEISRRIKEAILPPFFQAPQEISASEIGPAMDSNRFIFVIEIPPKFEQDLLSNRRPSVQINADATAIAIAGNGLGDLQQIIGQQVLSYVQNASGGPSLPVNFVFRVMFNPNLHSHWFTSVMQIINNITMLSVILTGAALIREREHGTIEHLLSMPVTPNDVMLAKIWANGLVIVFAAAVSMMIVVQLVLQVPIAGSLWLFLAGTLLYQFSVTALGILIATFTTSMAQFGLLCIPILVILQLLSGSSTPLETMPQWLQNVMQLAPTTHFVSFAQAVLYRGAGLAIVWPQMLAITVISALIFVLSGLRFRKTLVAMQ